MDDVMNEVFVKRMGGEPQTPARMNAIASYVNQLADVPRSTPTDGDAVARGAAIFHDPDVGCTACHDGPRMTNSTTVDVGTGGLFQVPSLVGLSRGGPYMHNGCAAKLRDRFTAPCGGGDRHGHTSSLSPAQIDDLVAYLASL
jgi:mono/diheme cytochrome c family protein